MDLDYQHIIENCGDGIIVLDPGGTMLMANGAFLSMSGYTQTEVLGKHYSVLLPARGDYQDMLNRTVTIDEGQPEQQTSVGRHWPEQGRLARRVYVMHKDGRLLLAEASASAFRDQQRGQAGTVIIVRSMSSLPGLECETKDSVQLLENIFENNVDGIIVTDRWGLIVKANSAVEAMLGSGRESIVGKSLSEIVAGMAIERPCDEEIKRLFVRLNESGLVDNYQASFRRADNELCHVEMHIHTLMGQDGNPAAAVITLRDVTERLKWEQQVLRTKRLESISALAEGVANDFSAIMTSILGEISMAQGFVNDQSQAYARLERAEHETLRARDLVEQLIIFSKSGKPDMQRGAIDEIVCAAAEQALKRPDIRYGVECGNELWPVAVDREQIQQVLKSLLLNAVHAMPEGGSIAIKIENMDIGKASTEALSQGRYIRITLRDEAIGILNEYIQDIFDPYFMRGRKRSGLVLATAYSVIKKHGGAISVESEFGSGTVFYIYLPALAA